MHYPNIVIVPKNGKLETNVAVSMGPHEDKGGFWDWYQIGGRWTGLFDGYDPEEDPANLETCRGCKGTGEVEKDGKTTQCYCLGTGKDIKWPTDWARHPGDVIPIEQLTQEQLDEVHRVVCPDGYGVLGGDEYLPWKESDCFRKRERPPLAWLKKTFAGYLAVVVDNHQ